MLSQDRESLSMRQVGDQEQRALACQLDRPAGSCAAITGIELMQVPAHSPCTSGSQGSSYSNKWIVREGISNWLLYDG
jgi:hypothetical protein